MRVSGTVADAGVVVRKRVRQLPCEIASGAVVNGGVAVVGNGIVDIQGASKENVRFVASGSGGLDLGDPTAYTGKVTGFGGSGHSNHNQFIDLTGVTFSSGVVSETYSGNTTSGVLTVTSGGTTVASIDLIGSYVTSDFHLAAGSGGSGTIITDPQGGQTSATIAAGSVLDINTPESGQITFTGSDATLVLDQTATFSATVAGFGALDSIDLSQIAFDAHTTLGYSENSNHTGGTLTVSGDGAEAARVALLRAVHRRQLHNRRRRPWRHSGRESDIQQQPLITKPHA